MNSSTKAHEKTMVMAGRRLRVLLSIMALTLLAYSAVCAGFYAWQNRLVFKPERALKASPARFGLAFEDLRIQAPDGTSLAAWSPSRSLTARRHWTRISPGRWACCPPRRSTRPRL